MLNTYQVLSRGHSCSAAGRPTLAGAEGVEEMSLQEREL